MAVITLTRTAIPLAASAPRPGWSVGYEGQQIAIYFELESGKLILADWTPLDKALRGQGKAVTSYAEFPNRDALLACYLRGADWWEAGGTRRVPGPASPPPQAGFRPGPFKRVP
jgi:hypothetical protein